VPDGLRLAGSATGGDGLKAWAESHVERLGELALARSRSISSNDSLDEFALSFDSEEAPTEFHDLLIDGPPPRRPRKAQTPSVGVALPRAQSTTPARAVAPRFSDDDLEEEDDPTQEAASLPIELRVAAQSLPPPPGLAMPVHVGPPPEAVKRKPRLPEGFLEDSAQLSPVALDYPSEVSDNSIGNTGFNPIRLMLPMAWVVIFFGLAVIAVVFVVYLVMGGTSNQTNTRPLTGPSLSDALPKTPLPGIAPPEGAPEVPPGPDVPAGPDGMADPEPESPKVDPVGPVERRVVRPPGHSVLFRSADPIAIIRVDCGEQEGSGGGSVRLYGLSDGDACTVTADLGQGMLQARWVVTEPATVECFHDGGRSCR
jgi:hypothetical protein